jgi:cobalt/nickel transport system permease protein
VHIPDGFLSTPVWAAMDAAALPAVALGVRRAQRDFEDARVPLLGVMGAFVFAAQMINFPVGIGTSSHLVGGALLALTLGPAAASVVMTAILVTQALVFQDGGLLALGANVMNMAIAGVLAGYLPYQWFGRGRWRRAAIFAGGALSVLVSATLAVTELLLSGTPMPRAALGVSGAVFVVSALLEGAITLAVAQSLEAIQPNFVRKPAERRHAAAALGAAAVLLAAVGVVFASTAPDGIERMTRAQAVESASWVGKAEAGLAGVALIYAVCLAIGRAVGRRRSA